MCLEQNFIATQDMLLTVPWKTKELIQMAGLVFRRTI